jgi:citrate lyase beta subunit
MLLERAEFRRAYVPSSSRSTGLSRSRLKSLRSAGVGAVAMIETPDGLFECETICRRLGPKSVLVGLFDLSVALGHHGDVQLSEVLAGVEREIGAVRAAGLPIPMPVFGRVPAGCLTGHRTTIACRQTIKAGPHSAVHSHRAVA